MTTNTTTEYNQCDDCSCDEDACPRCAHFADSYIMLRIQKAAAAPYKYEACRTCIFSTACKGTCEVCLGDEGTTPQRAIDFLLMCQEVITPKQLVDVYGC